ncbi:hypothetical protein SETIT_3G261100v2 [Setaria italica]|uniref:Uncharacterized protein n=1 Tax=Setaria italica TaxID=4555 RepID=A0A368QJ41_SETIT|nr:hypothetical protein SETIT_3G261100v2 [Setaria italica]
MHGTSEIHAIGGMIKAVLYHPVPHTKWHEHDNRSTETLAVAWEVWRILRLSKETISFLHIHTHAFGGSSIDPFDFRPPERNMNFRMSIDLGHGVCARAPVRLCCVGMPASTSLSTLCSKIEFLKVLSLRIVLEL